MEVGAICSVFVKERERDICTSFERLLQNKQNLYIKMFVRSWWNKIMEKFGKEARGKGQGIIPNIDFCALPFFNSLVNIFIPHFGKWRKSLDH